MSNGILPGIPVQFSFGSGFRHYRGSTRKFRRSKREKVTTKTIVNNHSKGFMETTTAQYLIQIKTDEGTMSFFKTMPTKPKTANGIKSQNNKLSKWIEKEYPNFIEYDITPV